MEMGLGMIKRLQRQAQFPNIGKLRKGAERPEKGNRPGEDLTFFRFDSTDQRAVSMFRSAYGDEPTTIKVYLPHATAEENFQCWQESWLAGGLQHRCDGEVCNIWLDNDGTYKTDPKPCPGGCKEVGRLMVIIPELQRFAYVTAETHSVHDIMRLTENLQAVEYLRGDLRGIPFVLKRTPVAISTPNGNGKRATREKWLLSIEVDPAWAALQLEAMHRNALPNVVDETRMLTVEVLDDDGDDSHQLPPEVAEWTNEEAPPLAAQQWAVEVGAQPNEHAAKNSMKKIVEDTPEGKLTKGNLNDVLLTYFDRQMEHLEDKKIVSTVDIPLDDDVPTPAGEPVEKIPAF